MKIVKTLTLLLLFGVTSTVNAQFWKKLKDHTKEAAEQTIERKVAEKAEKEIDKTFDTVFNNKGKLFKKNKAKKLDRYAFSHQYIMEITSDDNTTDITYYLTNDHEYMGSSFSAGKNQEYITVMDLPNTAIHTFMDMNGQKTMSSFNLNLDNVSDFAADSDAINVVSTGQTKTILGYKCEEFKVTGPQLSGAVWVTQDAGITFQKAFSQLKTKKLKRSKGVDPSWVSMVDGLVLEMKMIDYSQKKPKPITMRCTDLSTHEFTINTLEYNKSF